MLASVSESLPNMVSVAASGGVGVRTRLVCRGGSDRIDSSEEEDKDGSGSGCTWVRGAVAAGGGAAVDDGGGSSGERLADGGGTSDRRSCGGGAAGVGVGCLGGRVVGVGWLNSGIMEDSGSASSTGVRCLVSDEGINRRLSLGSAEGGGSSVRRVIPERGPVGNAAINASASAAERVGFTGPLEARYSSRTRKTRSSSPSKEACFARSFLTRRNAAVSAVRW